MFFGGGERLFFRKVGLQTSAGGKSKRRRSVAGADTERRRSAGAASGGTSKRKPCKGWGTSPGHMWPQILVAPTCSCPSPSVGFNCPLGLLLRLLGKGIGSSSFWKLLQGKSRLNRSKPPASRLAAWSSPCLRGTVCARALRFRRSLARFSRDLVAQMRARRASCWAQIKMAAKGPFDDAFN